MRTGKIKVQIDQAEHDVMDELFQKANEFLGGLLEIERVTLPYGDYILKAEGQKPIVFTFKEIKDYQQSFFSGHLFNEILALVMSCPENPTALIIARDENVRTPQDVHIWVDKHWQKRNFLIPTFKFGSRQKAVEFMIDCALKSDELQMIPRVVTRPPDYNQTVGLYSFYGVGVEKAQALAERFPVPMELFEDMKRFADYSWCQITWDLEKRKYSPDLPKAWEQAVGKKLTKKIWKEGRWWYGILGETVAQRIEDFILKGTEIPRRPRVGDHDE